MFYKLVRTLLYFLGVLGISVVMGAPLNEWVVPDFGMVFLSCYVIDCGLSLLGKEASSDTI